MNVDYRLLHHFRVSQRRELALRGALPARWRAELDAPRVEPTGRFGTVAPTLPARTVHLFGDDR